jgi:hypothetical protein
MASSRIQEGSGNIPQQTFITWNDPLGNRLVSINRDGSIFCQGVGFNKNGSLLTGPTPVVQDSEDLVASIAPTELSFTLPTTTLYAVTFYYGPSGVTGSGSWTPTITWTDPTGNNLSITSPLIGPSDAGDPNNFQSFVIPILVKGGTAIVVSGAYTGASFPMNISIRIVAMP